MKRQEEVCVCNSIQWNQQEHTNIVQHYDNAARRMKKTRLQRDIRGWGWGWRGQDDDTGKKKRENISEARPCAEFFHSQKSTRAHDCSSKLKQCSYKDEKPCRNAASSLWINHTHQVKLDEHTRLTSLVAIVPVWGAAVSKYRPWHSARFVLGTVDAIAVSKHNVIQLSCHAVI